MIPYRRGKVRRDKAAGAFAGSFGNPAGYRGAQVQNRGAQTQNQVRTKKSTNAKENKGDYS
jgi:hypothetical protein